MKKSMLFAVSVALISMSASHAQTNTPPPASQTPAPVPCDPNKPDPTNPNCKKEIGFKAGAFNTREALIGSSNGEDGKTVMLGLRQYGHASFGIKLKKDGAVPPSSTPPAEGQAPAQETKLGKGLHGGWAEYNLQGQLNAGKSVTRSSLIGRMEGSAGLIGFVKVPNHFVAVNCSVVGNLGHLSADDRSHMLCDGETGFAINSPIGLMRAGYFKGQGYAELPLGPTALPWAGKALTRGVRLGVMGQRVQATGELGGMAAGNKYTVDGELTAYGELAVTVRAHKNVSLNTRLHGGANIHGSPFNLLAGRNIIEGTRGGYITVGAGIKVPGFHRSEATTSAK
jgi:hypothetical protein